VGREALDTEQRELLRVVARALVDREVEHGAAAAREAALAHHRAGGPDVRRDADAEALLAAHGRQPIEDAVATRGEHRAGADRRGLHSEPADRDRRTALIRQRRGVARRVAAGDEHASQSSGDDEERDRELRSSVHPIAAALTWFVPAYHVICALVSPLRPR